MTAELRVPRDERERMTALGRAFRTEGNGKVLRLELMRNLRAAVQPGQAQVKDILRAWPHEGASAADPPMGSYLASRTRVQVRLSGRSAGVAVKVARTPGLRNFLKAGKALNSAKGWRHKVFGHDVWVKQISPLPGFFDKTLKRGKSVYRAAVIAAIKSMERRVNR